MKQNSKLIKDLESSRIPRRMVHLSEEIFVHEWMGYMEWKESEDNSPTDTAIGSTTTYYDCIEIKMAMDWSAFSLLVC